MFEAIAVVSGLDDMAVVRKPVEQGGCHLRITEDAGPFCEAEVGCDHNAGALVQLAQQVKQ